MKKLGALGESTFTSLCLEVDIVSTKPAEDENGWDSYMEFPYVGKEHISKDKQEAAIRCKVQIKATDKIDQKSLSIKLSAMHKLAIEQMPTFVCFMHFNKKRTVQDIYLVHIDSHVIYKILHRVRKAQVDGSKLNKQHINISYTNKNKLKMSTGEALKETIEQYISFGMEHYIKEKQKILKEIGYEQSSGEMVFHVKEFTNKKDFIEKHLIKQEKLKISISSFVEKRFGITMPIYKDVVFDNAEVKIKGKELEARISIKKNKFSKSIDMNMKLRLNPLFQRTPLFYNDLISITLDMSDTNSQFNFNVMYEFDKLYNLEDLISLVRVCEHIRDNKDFKSIWEFRVLSHKEPFALELENKENIKIDDKVIESVLIHAEIFKKLNVDINRMIKLGDILYNTKDAISFNELINKKTKNKITIEFETTDDFILEKAKKNSKLPFIISAIFEFDEVYYIVILGTKSQINTSKEEFTRIILQDTEAIENYEIAKMDYNEDDFFEEFKERAKALEYDEYVICHGNKTWLMTKDDD